MKRILSALLALALLSSAPAAAPDTATKTTETKPAEAKPAETKPAETKPAEAPAPAPTGSAAGAPGGATPATSDTSQTATPGAESATPEAPAAPVAAPPAEPAAIEEPPPPVVETPRPKLSPALTRAEPEPTPSVAETSALTPPEPDPVLTGAETADGVLSSLARRVFDEAHALRELLSPGSLLVLFSLTLLVVFSFTLVSRLTRAIQRAGYDVHRRLAGLPLLVSSALALALANLVMRSLLERSPLLAFALFFFFGGALLVGLGWRVQQTFAGALLTLRGSLREGDRVTVGDTTGMLEAIGPLRMRLRSADGAVHLLPLHRLDAERVTVVSPTRAQPVRLVVDRPAVISPEDREQIRQIALFCPYRESGTEVRLEVDPERPNRVVVALQAWSARGAETARDWLAMNLRDPE